MPTSAHTILSRNNTTTSRRVPFLNTRSREILVNTHHQHQEQTLLVINGYQQQNVVLREYFSIRGKYWVQKHRWEHDDVDVFDTHHACTYLVLRTYGAVAGGCRVIHKRRLAATQHLPIERETKRQFGDDAVELSRFCIDTDMKTGKHLTKECSAKLLYYFITTGVTVVYAVLNVALYRLLCSEFVIVPITQNHIRHGKSRFVPVYIDCIASWRKRQ